MATETIFDNEHLHQQTKLTFLKKGALAMRTKNYPLVVGVMLLAILLTNFGLFIAPVFSSESVEQQRTECLSRCNSPTGSDMYFYGGGGNSLWQLRSMCVNNCEKKFWKKWEKEMDETDHD